MRLGFNSELTRAARAVASMRLTMRSYRILSAFCVPGNRDDDRATATRRQHALLCEANARDAADHVAH